MTVKGSGSGAETKVSRDTLVQLFFLLSSGLMACGHEYGRTGMRGGVTFIGIGGVNEQRTNRAKEL